MKKFYRNLATEREHKGKRGEEHVFTGSTNYCHQQPFKAVSYKAALPFHGSFWLLVPTGSSSGLDHFCLMLANGSTREEGNKFVDHQAQFGILAELCLKGDSAADHLCSNFPLQNVKNLISLYFSSVWQLQMFRDFFLTPMKKHSFSTMKLESTLS